MIGDMVSTLHIEMIPLGSWQTNCYVVHAEGGSGVAKPLAAWIIDAGYEPTPMLRYIRQHELVVEKIILTHAHLDHIGGLAEVHNAFPGVPILIHDAERDFLTDPMLNLSAMCPPQVIAPNATGFLHHGDVLELDGLKFHVRHTPGHSPGGITLYQPDNRIALVGDTLFAGSIGRHDFPTSDPRKLFASIAEQLLSLPDDVKVYPGHGPATTIGEERESNPFL